MAERPTPGPHPVQEPGPHGLGVGHEAVPLHDLQVRERRRAGDRVGSVRVGVDVSLVVPSGKASASRWRAMLADRGT